MGDNIVHSREALPKILYVKVRFIKRKHVHYMLIQIKYFSFINKLLPSPGCTGAPAVDDDTPEANLGLGLELTLFEDCF